MHNTEHEETKQECIEQCEWNKLATTITHNRVIGWSHFAWSIQLKEKHPFHGEKDLSVFNPKHTTQLYQNLKKFPTCVDKILAFNR